MQSKFNCLLDNHGLNDKFGSLAVDMFATLQCSSGLLWFMVTVLLVCSQYQADTCYGKIQGYGAQSAEEKQRLFKLMRNLNFNGESGSDTYMPAAQTYGGVGESDAFYSPEFRGDFGAGLLDLHAMDDTELLSEV